MLNPLVCRDLPLSSGRQHWKWDWKISPVSDFENRPNIRALFIDVASCGATWGVIESWSRPMYFRRNFCKSDKMLNYISFSSPPTPIRMKVIIEIDILMLVVIFLFLLGKFSDCVYIYFKLQWKFNGVCEIIGQMTWGFNSFIYWWIPIPLVYIARLWTRRWTKNIK